MSNREDMNKITIKLNNKSLYENWELIHSIQKILKIYGEKYLEIGAGEIVFYFR